MSEIESAKWGMMTEYALCAAYPTTIPILPPSWVWSRRDWGRGREGSQNQGRERERQLESPVPRATESQSRDEGSREDRWRVWMREGQGEAEREREGSGGTNESSTQGERQRVQPTASLLSCRASRPYGLCSSMTCGDELRQ